MSTNAHTALPERHGHASVRCWPGKLKHFHSLDGIRAKTEGGKHSTNGGSVLRAHREVGCNALQDFDPSTVSKLEAAP